MTVEEIASLPEARLGGSLAWMFWLAVALGMLPLLGVALMFAAIAAGSIHSGPITWLIGVYGGPADLGIAYMIPVAFIVAWALVFAAMTAVHLSATPAVASAGMVIWVVLRFAFGYLGQALMLTPARSGGIGETLINLWPFATNVTAEAILAAAFCGYMATARRPNAYYRRRLPTG